MVTIREVAKLAGVSMTTVSRAFNPNAVIKEETRQTIFKIANDIGYAPNLSARGLVTNKKFVIGVFLSSIHTHMSTYLSEILSNIHSALPDDYLLSVEGIDRISNFDQKVKNRFDGILVVSQSAADNEFIYKLQNNHIPMVVILRKIDNPEIDNIYADDEQAIKIGDFNPLTGKKLMREILALPISDRPTCVLCANDDMALGAIRACYEQGVRVPDDMSIMGFDNISYAELSTPPLTTITNPIQKMGSVKNLV